MPGEKFAQWLRFGAVALFSMLLASCGSGSGESSVDVSDEEAAAAEMRLVFADYFGDAPTTNGKTIAKAALPLGNWVVDTGYGPDNDGNGNDEWQLYTNSIDNVFTENGNLVLRAQCSTPPDCGKRNDTITSGKVVSKGRINVKFGNVKARIKMPDGGGMWPAFWMLGADIDERPWPDAGEIDIVEMFYYFSDNRTTHATMHWAGPLRDDGLADGCADIVKNIPIDSDNEVHRCFTDSKEFEAKDGFAPLTDDFHVYELDWTEDRIVGKIDGIQYFARAIDGSTMEEFLKDYYMILNVAVGGNLGGQDGPWMTAAEWSDPNKTDMLVDYVEVRERVPATNATLIGEDGGNIRYSGILNSINAGGGLVEVDLKNEDVTALVGSQTMSIRFSTTFTGEPGSRPVDFSGATFDFYGQDLADFGNFVFSLDSSRFEGFNDISVEFEDRDGNKAKIRTGNYKPIAFSGNWRTYSIPMGDFPGVDMNNIVGIGFFDPYDVNNNLLAGTLYFDDIRFVGSSQCNSLSSLEFDQVNYNPDTAVAAINVNDPCAANRQVQVKAENESGAVYLPAKLDAAGNGRAILNLGKSDSAECVANDTTGVLQLTTGLMASYDRPMGAKGGANSSFAAAGVDANAPITVITGDTDYIISSTKPTSFVADTDFNFSDFGTSSTFNGSFDDGTDLSPVFAVSNVANGLPQMALFNFITGFTRSTGTIDMKVKNLPTNNFTVKFGNTVANVTAESTYTVDVLNDLESTPLDDDWFLVSIPMDKFSTPDLYNYVVFAADQTANPATFLITDIALQERIGNLPAACATGGGGGGPATGGSVPEVSIYAADGSVADLSPNFDPFTSGTGIATVMDSSYTQALELTSGNGYGVSLVQLGLSGLTFTGYDEFLFKVKGLTADNTIVVKFEATGGGVVNVDITNPPANVTTEVLGDGWTQVIMNLSAFGDVSASSQIVFQTLDNAYAVDEKILLTDIGFNNAGGGSATGGSVPEVSIYEADGSVADLSPNYDPFTSGTGIATVMDSSYTQALQLTSADGYGVSLVQLGLTGLSFTGYDEFLFKVKGLTADNTIVVKFEATGGGVVNVDITNPPANVTTEVLGDGWTQVVMNLSAFGDVSASSQIVFQTLDNAYAVGATILLTDIGFNNGGGGPGGNLTTNGDFELGDLSGWTPGAGSGSIAAVNDQDSGSTWAGRIFSPMANGAALSQANLAAGTVQPGDTLDIAFDLCGTLSGISGEFRPAVLSEFGMGAGATRQDLQNFATLPNVWTRYNFQAIAGADVTGGVSLQFDAICGAVAGCEVEAFIDNVSITIGGGMVPGTASGLSCAAGGGGGNAQSFANEVLYSSDTTAFPEDFVLGTDYVEITPFSSGTVIAEVTSDADYPRALGFTSGFGYGGNVAQLAFAGFSAGFISSYESIEFKVKNTTTNIIRFKAEPEGSNPFIQIDLTTDPRSTSLGNDWYQVVIPVSEMGTVTGATQIVFEDNTAFGNPTAYQLLLTDIGFNYFADEVLYSSDTTAFPEDFVLGTDYVEITPFSSGTVIAEVTSDADYPRALGFTSGFGYGGNVAQLAFAGFSAGFISSYESIEFKVKNTTTNIIRFKAEPEGSNPFIQIDLTTDPRSTSLGNDWYQVVIPVSEMGTVTGATQIVFEDNTAFGNPTAYQLLLTDIGFNYMSAGGGGGGSAMGVLNTNGDFETGDFTGVETFPNAGTVTISSVNPRAGTFAANLNVPNPGGDALIKFANLSPGGFTAGQTIHIKFYMRGSLTTGGVGFAEFFSELSGGGVSKAEILFGNAPIFPNGDPSVWTLFETTTTTGSDSSGGVTLQLKAGSGGGSANLFFDDVCVSTEPCP